MITVIVALALLSSEGLTGWRLSPDISRTKYIFLLSPVRAIAVRAEILGTKESLLVSQEAWQKDCKRILFRIQRTLKLPILSSASKFDYKEILIGRTRAELRVRHLQEINRWDWSSIQEARRVLYIYEMLADSIAYREYRPFEARLLLKRVMESLGEDFDAGKLPRIAAPARCP